MSRRSLPRSLPEQHGSAGRPDTIFALSSGRPPAAVAIIRNSGPGAHQAGSRIAGRLPPPRSAALRKLVDPNTGEPLDDALVLRFDAPASASGEDVVEFHCHGGRAVVDAVLARLAGQPGLRAAEPGEFTRRAFENGRIDLTQAEGLADLLEAETEAQRKAALAMAEGGLRSAIEQWRGLLVELSARAERAIDYADEEESGEDAALRSDCKALATELQAWLDRPRVEPLRDGVRIVAAGPPNSGKSSLVNKIAGNDRAIVSAVPGTTRDHIEVPLALAGIPILLTDTAGLRDTSDAVEAIGVARAAAQIELADILLWLGDGQAPAHALTVLIHARADLPERQQVAPGRLAVSALTGAGICDLLAILARMAGDLLPPVDAIALNRRQAAHILAAANIILDTLRSSDVAVLADGLRQARAKFDQLSGRAGIEDVLDSLFARFCLGK